MTCIVGILDKKKKRVYMAADSMGSSGWTAVTRADKKIFRNGDFLFGCAGSFRMISIIRYSFKPPKHPKDMPVDEYMNTLFIDELRDTFRKGGFLTEKDGVHIMDGEFLVAYRGHLFSIDGDFQVGTSATDYAACGGGWSVAVGSLFTTTQFMDSPKLRLQVALEAAEEHVTSVRGPFIFESMKEKS